MPESGTIRPARPADVAAIVAMVRELAEYERALPEVRAGEADFTSALFGPHPAVFAHVVTETADGPPVGFALWFRNFSTWLGRPGIYLEDLYVRPSCRGRGYGIALLRELARIAVAEGYGRLDWAVLDWNAPAIGFYRSLGAAPVDGWHIFRLTGEPLAELGRAGWGRGADPAARYRGSSAGDPPA